MHRRIEGPSVGAGNSRSSFLEFVEKLVLIAGCGKHTDWAIGIGEAQRHAIVSDANFEGGDYEVETGGPKDGLATSRMMAMLSYRATGEHGREIFEDERGR